MDWDAYREQEDAYRQAAQSADVEDVSDRGEPTGGAPAWERDLRNPPWTTSGIRLGGRGGVRWQRGDPSERIGNAPSVQASVQRANFANNPPPPPPVPVPAAPKPPVPRAPKPPVRPRPPGKLPGT